MKVDKSANIELCVICRSFLKLKIQIGQTLFRMRCSRHGCATEEAGMKVRSVPFTWDFKLPRRNSGVVLNGEFDSGSERTLAAWIRHASRARFFPVAIQGKV